LPSRWAFWLRLGLTAACLWAGWRWWSHQPPLEGFTFLFPWCLAALALSPVVILLRAWKWRTCLRGLGRPSLGECLRSYVGALPLGMLTPGRAGELARPLFFRDPRLRHVEASGRLLLDNWTDTLAVLLWSLPGCIWLWGGWGFAAATALFLMLAWMPFWLGLGRLALGGHHVPDAVEMAGKGRSRWQTFRVLALRWLPPPEAIGFRLLTLCTLWGLAAYAAELLQFLFLLKGLGLEHLPWWHLIGGLALVHLANSVQFTLAGIGPREGMTVWLLAKLGLNAGVLLSASSLQTLLILILPALVGLLFKPVALSEASKA